MTLLSDLSTGELVARLTQRGVDDGDAERIARNRDEPWAMAIILRELKP